MSSGEIGLTVIDGAVRITIGDQVIDPGARITLTAAELDRFTEAVAKESRRLGAAMGAEHVRRASRKRRYIERDENQRIVALVEELPPSNEEAPPALPVKQVPAKQIGFVKRGSP